jgi:hypothetical protein
MLSGGLVWMATPFALQGIAMSVDEFYFHRQRGLGSWESRGHPLDSLSFALPIAVVGFFPERAVYFFIFLFLAVFSTIFITKDEWVHKLECTAAEQWLHSILFILHPVVLIEAYLIWPKLAQDESARNLLRWFLAIILMFLTYQTCYWNFYVSSKRRITNRQSALQRSGISVVSRSR